jgi:hypothetical protein
MAKRANFTLEHATSIYVGLSETALSIKRRVGDDNLIVVRHESIIADPKVALKELCAFLSMTSPDDYLEDCASIVYGSPHKSRHEAQWTPELIADVGRQLRRFPFLDGYEWDD